MSPESIQIDAPVVQVIFAEDRAQVLRRAHVLLPGGPALLVVEGLSPLTATGSVVASLSSGEIGRVAVRHLRVDRSVTPEADDHALEEEGHRLDRALAQADGALAEARSRVEACFTALSRCRELVAAESLRGGDPARWAADLELLTLDLQAATGALPALRRQHHEATEARARWSFRRDARPRPEQVLRARVELAVDGPAGAATLELQTVLPSALWRPSYVADLVWEGEQAFLDWQVRATVWQRTAEDWSQVAVTLSTARPSADARLPPLAEDRLQLRDKRPEERRRVDADFRELSVQSAEDGEAEPTLPGVDDGGEARVFHGERPVDLPPDGRPHTVAIGRFRTPATARWCCQPASLAGVYREVTAANRLVDPSGQGQALLAGPVVLQVEGAIVGLGEIGFVGPGGPIRLSFGTEGEVVVRHERARVLEERFARSDLTWFVTRTDLRHTGPDPIDLELLERVPTSELAQVSVPLWSETTPGAEGPDAHGHLRWKIRLEPGEQRKIQLGFRVEKPDSVSLPDPW